MVFFLCGFKFSFQTNFGKEVLESLAKINYSRTSIILQSH
jgi:hypothetical protein